MPSLSRALAWRATRAGSAFPQTPKRKPRNTFISITAQARTSCSSASAYFKVRVNYGEPGSNCVSASSSIKLILLGRSGS
jgi:hypothetical protein